MYKSLINNFTHNEIQGEISPTFKKGKIISIKLNPRDKTLIKHNNSEYNILITKLNKNSVNMVFTIKFSKYMAFMSDILDGKLFLRNFINSKIYYNLNPNVSFETTHQDINKNGIYSYTSTTTTNTNRISADSLYNLETSTNQGIRSSKIECKMTSTTESIVNGVSTICTKNRKLETYEINEFFILDDADEEFFKTTKKINCKNHESSFKKMLKKNNSINEEISKKLSKEKRNEKRNPFPHEILISNISHFPIFVKLSSGAEQEKSIIIETDDFYIFDRKKLSIYRLNICYTEHTLGPVYNVKTGCAYDFDNSGNLTSPSGEHLLSILNVYNPKFAKEDSYGILVDENDLSAKKPIDNNVVIANKSHGSVNINIQSLSFAEHEASIQIEPLIYVKFPRIGNSFKMTIIKSNGKNAMHDVENGRCYEIVGDNQNLIDVNGEKEVKRNFTKNFLEKPKNNLLKNVDKQTGIKLLENNKRINLDIWGNKWQKFRSLVISNPCKEKLKDFNNLLFRFITIKNNSKNVFHVRIITRNIGSQEFEEIEPNGIYKWKRTDGEFLTEIVDSDLNSKRYYLKSDCEYQIDSNGKVLIGNTNKEISNVFEYLQDTDTLIVFDKQEKKYVSKKINYKNFDKKSSKIHIYEPEEEKLEYFNNIKPNYTPGERFTDPEFPPDRTSFEAVDKNGEKRPKHFAHAKKGLSKSQIDQLTFKNPKDVFDGKYYLYKDDISIEDVKQGQIGNCYLISVLASLSQRPDLIYKVFKSRTVNPDGFYELYYYENSKKKVMFIDDNIVMFNSKYLSEFQFAKPNGEELWVMLLEKAYAKYEGGYSNIIGGKMYQELTWLTGALCRQIKTDNLNAWNELFNGIQQNFIITTSSNRGTGNHNNKTANGIANGHAYSIIGANEFLSGDGDIRLLRMRNPWGHTEWKGDFSDNSSKWTQELKDYFEYDKYMGDDGIFFIPFEDYKKEFSSFVICCIDAGKK